MLKIIHCADVHLGSKMEAKLPKAKVEERRTEVRNTFHRMVEYAKNEGVSVILLAGDVFDSDRPLKKDKEFFYKLVEQNPELDFLYLRGNHDGAESYTQSYPNLKTFSEAWTGYDYGDVRISGIELSRENAQSLYSTLQLDAERKNIVLLHGQIGSASGVDKINLTKLAEKNIDYLALGHIHSYSENKLDGRGRYAYSGCLEGRGFDECGEKGFVKLTVSDVVQGEFIPFAARTIREYAVDVTGTDGYYTAARKVKADVRFRADDLYRIELVGELDYDHDTLASDVADVLKTECYFLSVKDKTVQKLDLKDYEGDISLRGEFIRAVMNNPTWTEERKGRVAALGLKALSGREVE